MLQALSVIWEPKWHSPYKFTLQTSQQHSIVTSYVNICVCVLQMPAEGSITPSNTSIGEHLYLLVRGGGPWLCSSLDQERLQAGNLSPSLRWTLLLSSGQFLEKPLCAHYSEAHAFQTAAMAKKSEERWAVILWEAHIPQGSISGPADQADYECTVPCSTATMETPCKWAWEWESHGHQKGKQGSFITATEPIHSTNKKHITLANLCH